MLSKHILGHCLSDIDMSIYNFESILFESAQANNYCIRWSKKGITTNNITEYNIGKATATVRMKWSNKKDKNTAGKEYSHVIILKLHENEKDRWHIYNIHIGIAINSIQTEERQSEKKRNRALIIILQRKQL